MNERVYAMDVKYPVLAVATATVPENVTERGVTRSEKKNKIFVYDLASPTQPFRTIDSPLKFQHRCIQIFPDRTGFAVGSVEGRVAISHVQEKDVSKNFAFKCHRIENDIYAVNSLAFHHYGTFATAGSDGVYTFWDKVRSRQETQRGPTPARVDCIAVASGALRRIWLLMCVLFRWCRLLVSAVCRMRSSV